MPISIDAQVCPPVTSTGVLLPVVQQYAAPAVVTPQIWALPVAIDAQVCPPVTTAGVPLPPPQQYAAPVVVTPQVYRHPPLTVSALPLETETVTVDVPLAAPDVAVIVADPFATAVTNPEDDTVATPVFDEAQVTSASEIVDPPESLTVAVSVAVSPRDAKVLVLGDTVTVVAT